MAALKLKTNAKTAAATTMVAFVGTTLQTSTALRPPCIAPSIRGGPVYNAPLSAGKARQTIPSTARSGSVQMEEIFSRRKTGLSNSPFDENEPERLSDNEGSRGSTQAETAANQPSVLDSTITASQTKQQNLNNSGADNDSVRNNLHADDGGNDPRQEDEPFAVPLALGTEDWKNFDDDESRRIVAASEKLVKFLKEEAPPVSIVLLNIVAVIWGSQHAIIKTVVDDSDPAAFTFLRFGLASLIASPYLPGLKDTILKRKDESTDPVDIWKPWRWGIEMGLWMFLGFSLQAIGLQSTTAQRSGFLLYLNVKFVPFFAKVLLGRQISKWTWLSAFAAFSGTALLALDGQSLGMNVGDVWSVLAAAASAMFILRLEKASSEVPKSSELNATSLIVVAMLSGAWLLLGSSGSQIAAGVTETAMAHPLELVYLGAISTALANFIQAKAQKDVPAERASIIYSLDPVYGAFFSWIILGETLGGPQAYAGASIIFVAAASNSLLEFSKDKESKE